ncbi:RhuM family protein [Sulfurimonas sp.]|uniref:RhuM family protein n=1 Tax=Sulfurimonas sp. TaxID=2022749 RepID=UPI00286E672D|nr:RhuM family protein [Sulfurimonas sp.]
MNNQIKSDIIIYKDINGEIKLDVSLENDTVRLNQKQMSLLFDVHVPAINKHIKNILADGDISKMETVQKEGGREVVREIDFYNLDMIISLGYRVNSKRATSFRDSKYLGGIDG